MIKRFALFLAVCLCFAIQAAVAQSSEPVRSPLEIGIFADDLRFGRISPTLDMPGAGARLSISPQSPIQLEIEASYNFAQSFTTSWSNGFVTHDLTTHLRDFQGLVGVKFNKKLAKRMRGFGTAKVGFLDFNSSTANVPEGFTNPQTPATAGGTDLVVYGGAGLEYSFGRFGLRFDAGDDLYFDHGHRFNNIRATFGPTFRF